MNCWDVYCFCAVSRARPVVQFQNPGRFWLCVLCGKDLTAKYAEDSQSAQRNASGKIKLHHYLNIQVLDVQRVVFDELAPRFHILTHQRGENGLTLGEVFQLHL